MPGDESVWEDLGLALYRRRLELGIPSQRELAKRAGVHHNTVSKLELGQSWTRRGASWAKIEAVLELPEGWIADFVARRTAVPALTPDAVERAVLDSIAEVTPHVTIRQARAVAKATVRQLEREGFLSGS